MWSESSNLSSNSDQTDPKYDKLHDQGDFHVPLANRNLLALVSGKLAPYKYNIANSSKNLFYFCFSHIS